MFTGAPEPPADKPNHSEVTADSVTLCWYGPAYDGGSVVTGYTVEARKAGQQEWYTLISGSVIRPFVSYINPFLITVW